MTSNRWLRAIAGLVVAGVFLALLAGSVSWGEVRQILARADWRILLLGLAALTLDLAARIARWWLMLRAADPSLSFTACVRPFLGSLALNNTVPFRAGDVVRVFGFRRALRAPAAHVAGTVMLERMLDLLVLLLILFAGLLGTSSVFPRAFTLAAAAAGAVTLASLAALTAFPQAVTGTLQLVVTRLFSGRTWLPSVHRIIAQVTAALALLRSRRAAAVLALSVLAWVLEGAVFASVAWALHLPVPWVAPWLALAAATLATLLPSSPGYVGTFDYFAALGLSAYGAPAAPAAAFALLTHLLLWLPVTAAGLGALAFGWRSRKVPESIQPDSRVPA
ncbi:MAG TPA: lysylphosphatidylglycerol synthase transmembrane domain-containing protein [Gemmatimonadales bacterium]|nr:lysylphosphatidylglycerol synthase transmembrane domain-containing protein [Gemmatimonadales bacterium]